jgi:phenylalanyl-tRNA synthetase beta chain
MASSMLDTIAHNHSRRNSHLALFELGKVYLPKRADNSVARTVGAAIAVGEDTICLKNIDEVERLTLARTGELADFYALKAVVLSILPKSLEYTIVQSKCAHYNPYASLDIVVGECCIGSVGEVSPMVLDEYGIDVAVVLAELDLPYILAYVPPTIVAASVSKYQSVLRDISIVVDDNVSVGSIISVVKQAALLQCTCTLLDVYKGAQIDAGRKSVSLRLELMADRTINDSESVACMSAVVAALQDKCGAVLRS